MVNYEEIISYSLFFIGLLISLLVPLPIKEEYRLFIIAMIFFAFLVMALSNFNKKAEENNNKIEEINKRFKTIEELNDIRLNIKELQRKVFKNG